MSASKGLVSCLGGSFAVAMMIDKGEQRLDSGPSIRHRSGSMNRQASVIRVFNGVRNLAVFFSGEPVLGFQPEKARP